MAVGDPVIAQGAVNTILTFQPAATVTVVLTCFAGLNTVVRITDGAVHSLLGTVNYEGVNPKMFNIKCFINNTYYLHMDASVGYGGFYSGIQVA
tara:strand:+ start:708 stop:989 length:282 start_codon:yes stop_codon:yes gene_type:complete